MDWRGRSSIEEDGGRCCWRGVERAFLAFAIDDRPILGLENRGTSGSVAALMAMFLQHEAEPLSLVHYVLRLAEGRLKHG